MKSYISVTTAALIGLVASCSPYKEPPPVPPTDPAHNSGVKKPETPENKTVDNNPNNSGGNTGENPPEKPPTITDPPPKPDPNPSRPVAKRIPGMPGFVFSPFNNKKVDVSDIASGTLVVDPTYPASAKKYFYVP